MAESVRKMKEHFANALRLIEASASENNDKIREEIKSFFSLAQEIQRKIAEVEANDIDTLKMIEIQKINEQKENVLKYLDHFHQKLGDIESSLRHCISENSVDIQC